MGQMKYIKLHIVTDIKEKLIKIHTAMPKVKTTPKVEGKRGRKPGVRNKKRWERYGKKQSAFSRYIYLVLKQVHPELSMSRKGMSVMNSFVNDMFERLASEAGMLVKQGGRKTLRGREVQTASRLFFLVSCRGMQLAKERKQLPSIFILKSNQVLHGPFPLS